ncbi:MAG: oligosaccharide flippase family protein [Ruminococcus sp.]|nr:oligosaccharide flippase family protein [Ruminococcus sp.]
MISIKKYIDKYHSLPVGVRAAFWFVVCSVVQNGAKFLAMPVLVRLLTVEQYGDYNVFLSWTNIITIFATLRLDAGVFNNAMYKFPENRNEYTAAVQSLSSAAVVVCFIVYAAFPAFWNGVFGLPSDLSVMIFVQLLFTEGFLMWMARQRYEYKYMGLLAWTAVFSLAYLFVPIIAGMMSVQDMRLRAVIYSGVFIQFVFGLGFSLYNYFKGKIIFKKEYWKYALGFNVPLIPHYLSTIILGESDRIMIKNIVGSARAGIYSFTYTISLVISIITYSVNSALVPQTYKALGNKDFKSLKSVINMLLVMMGGLVLMFTAIAPEFIKFFSTEEYYDAIRLVPVISVSSYFTFLYCIFANVEFFFEANKFIAAASVVGAVLNVLLNGLLIPVFGYYAAGYTTFVCYGLFAVVHFIFMRIVGRRKGITEEIYDYKSVLLISIGVTAATFFMLAIYDHWQIRYGVLLAGLAAAVINRRKIADLITTVRKK